MEDGGGSYTVARKKFFLLFFSFFFFSFFVCGNRERQRARYIGINQRQVCVSEDLTTTVHILIPFVVFFVNAFVFFLRCCCFSPRSFDCVDFSFLAFV